MHWEGDISMLKHTISEKRPRNALDEEDASYWRFDVNKSIMDAADDSILEERGSTRERFGSEAAEKISVVDDGDGEFDD
ncbi:hypothetical protein V498_01003 [Pseudogymnoascus sp. VKM F-4517 (FW-2822)]|nr:hypothetical protein V498_01003 [Pseudogymnoascus sp. VKM F-4517 (FW-2822)]